MFAIFCLLLSSLRSCLSTRTALQAEILALRHQLLVLQRSTRGRRLRLKSADRVFWIWLSRLWKGWRCAVRIVKPETIIAWNRKGFRLYWTWKSRARDGRPPTNHEICALIRKMSITNSALGCPAYSWRTSEARHRYR
jgi:putative transposase